MRLTLAQGKRGLMMNSDKVDLVHYLNNPVECSCGRTHFAGIEFVEIGDEALDKVASIVRNAGYQKPFVIADCNTQKIAGEVVLEKLSKEGIPASSFVFDDPALSPNESALGTLLMNFDPTCDLILGVGSGTINDLSRFFSYQLGMQYFIVATAPSMDGYASSVAPLLKNNLKTTFECHVPKAIVADLDILSKAPVEMIAAGFGDVLGKYTCLADWQLSAIINDEYYCDRVAALTRHSLEKTIGLRKGIASGDKKAIGELMETLILSGVAISYVGNSRPASGSEHHLAHFWEMRLLWGGRSHVLHGTNVGIGTVLILQLYQYLLQENLDPKTFESIQAPLSDTWSADIERVFLEGASEVLALEEKARKNDLELHKDRLAAIAQNWDQILQTLATVPSPAEARALLAEVHAPFEPAHVGIEPQLVSDALLFAKEIRARYTVLQLLWDLNLLRNFAGRIVLGAED